jgi:hypothetical protein
MQAKARLQQLKDASLRLLQLRDRDRLQLGAGRGVDVAGASGAGAPDARARVMTLVKERDAAEQAFKAAARDLELLLITPQHANSHPSADGATAMASPAGLEEAAHNREVAWPQTIASWFREQHEDERGLLDIVNALLAVIDVDRDHGQQRGAGGCVEEHPDPELEAHSEPISRSAPRALDFEFVDPDHAYGGHHGRGDRDPANPDYGKSHTQLVSAAERVAELIREWSDHARKIEEARQTLAAHDHAHDQRHSDFSWATSALHMNTVASALQQSPLPSVRRLHDALKKLTSALEERLPMHTLASRACPLAAVDVRQRMLAPSASQMVKICEAAAAAGAKSDDAALVNELPRVRQLAPELLLDAYWHNLVRTRTLRICMPRGSDPEDS